MERHERLFDEFLPDVLRLARETRPPSDLERRMLERAAQTVLVGGSVTVHAYCRRLREALPEETDAAKPKEEDPLEKRVRILEAWTKSGALSAADGRILLEDPHLLVSACRELSPQGYAMGRRRMGKAWDEVGENLEIRREAQGLGARLQNGADALSPVELLRLLTSVPLLIRTEYYVFFAQEGPPRRETPPYWKALQDGVYADTGWKDVMTLAKAARMLSDRVRSRKEADDDEEDGQ